MRIFKRRVRLRLPQDAGARETKGVPRFDELRGSVREYAEMHLDALSDGDFHQRAVACWGLVAQGTAALEWVGSELASGDETRISDAAGVLRWVGVPEDWRRRLSWLAADLPDGEAADAIHEALGHDDSDELAERAASGRREPDQLYDGAMLPFTEPIWFVEAAFPDVVDAVRSWCPPGSSEPLYATTALSAPLPRMLAHLEPWAMPSWKHLLVATTGAWTAVFSQGSDVYTADVVGERLRRRSIRTHYAPHISRDGEVVSHGDRALWISDPADPTRSRCIQASYQSRWEWGVSGEPQHFERPDAYTARRIPDRFTLAMLTEYCRALGIKRADPTFYLDRGLLVEGKHHAARTVPSFLWRTENR